MLSLNDPSSAPAPLPFPLRLAEEKHFTCVRSHLRKAQFNEPSLCRILGLSELRRFPELDSKEVHLRGDAPPNLLALVKLFFLMLPLPAVELEQLMPAEFLNSLQALDLLRLCRESDGNGQVIRSYASPVWLYPVQEFLMASDQGKDTNQAVFPALGELTFRFLKLLGDISSSSVLDLCSGSGIAGLKLSQHSERVVASDISDRAVHFAKFNCRLNDCRNMQVVQSDFYSALAGEKFDLIVAHPPYVPSLLNDVVWRDGGDTGEIPIRRIVEGLVQFLQPGGTFLSACAGFDTETQPFEERVRGWLGESHPQFDIIFAVRREIPPGRLALDLTEVSPDLEIKDVRTLEARFQSMGASRHVNGALYVFRRNAGNPLKEEPLTLRARLSPISNAASFSWLKRWTHNQTGLAGQQILKKMKPRISSQLLVRVTYGVKEGVLAPIEYALASGKPFLAETLVELGMVKILEEFNGLRTFKELFELGRSKSLVPENLEFEKFLEFGAKMVERGYAEIDDSMLDSRATP